MTTPAPASAPVNLRHIATTALLTLAGALVLLFVVEHVRDAHRNQELVRLHQTIAADSTVRTAAVANTIAAGVQVDSSVRASARVDTVWRRVVSTATARVDTIVLSTKPDTVKIRELVQVDSALIIAGNALADTNRTLRVDAIDFKAKVAEERAAWAKERADQATALAVSEAQHRHWGLGATLGPTLLRDPSGIVRAGPIGVSVGLTYRW